MADQPSPATGDDSGRAGDGGERGRILSAFRRLAVERGYAGLDLAVLLGRAGVDEDAFYGHFEGLEEVEQLMAVVLGAFAAEQRWRDQLRAVSHAMLRFLQEDPVRARIMIVEVLDGGAPAREIRDRGMEGLTALIDLGRNELEDPGTVTRATADGIAAAIYDRLHVAVEAGDMAVGDRLVPELMYTAVLPYVGPEAAEEELGMSPPPSGPS